MWKIIGSLAVIAVIVLFITFNISHVSDISFIIFTVPDVPVYLTIFISLLLGALGVLPFSLSYRKEKRQAKSIEHLEQEINDTFSKKFEEVPEKGKKGRKKKQKASDTSIDVSP